MTRRARQLVIALAMSVACYGVARGGPVTWSARVAPIQLPEGIAEINEAIEKFKQRDYEQCQLLLKSAAANHPGFPPGPIIFAKLCIRLDQPAMGRAALEDAAVRYGDFPELYLLFGRLALEDNHLTDAQLQFEKAAALAVSQRWSSPNRERLLVQVYEGLLAVAVTRKDWTSAAANADAWLNLEPGNGRARARMAESLFHQGKRDRARVELERAVKDDPALGSAAMLMGQFGTDEGDLETASRWMREVVERSPNDPAAHLRYANWLFEYGDANEARSEAEAVLRLDPGNVQASGLRGLVARSLKDYAAAAEIFQNMHAKRPDSFPASNLLALCLAEGQTDEQRGKAWKLAQQNIERTPTAEALTTYGWVAFRMGKSDEAERSLHAALATGKGTSETAFYLASVLAHLGKNDEIRQLLKMSLSAPGRFLYPQGGPGVARPARARPRPRLFANQGKRLRELNSCDKRATIAPAVAAVRRSSTLSNRGPSTSWTQCMSKTPVQPPLCASGLPIRGELEPRHGNAGLLRCRKPNASSRIALCKLTARTNWVLRRASPADAQRLLRICLADQAPESSAASKSSSSRKCCVI